MKTKQQTKTSLLLGGTTKEERAWSSIRGIWKDKKIAPVAYQRKLREASEVNFRHYRA